MDWSKGFSASYYMMAVDPVTWADTEHIEITGGSVSRTISGLRQSADLSCTDFKPETERWIRVYLDASQDGDAAHEPLFTGLAAVSEENIDGVLSTYPVDCYSVLKPAQDVLLERGFYIHSGTYCGQIFRDLLSVTPAPLRITAETPKINGTIIAEGSETHLSMTEKVLAAIGWQMQISGDGTILIGPIDATAKASFGLDNDVIEPKLTLRSDWFKCPNVFRATSGDVTAIVRDDSRNSLLSTVNRGREIWKEDSSVTLGNNEGLQQYAARRLAEEQAYAYKVRYIRRFDPAVSVGDAVRLHYPEQGLMGEYIVTSQQIQLEHGAPVSEEVQR